MTTLINCNQGRSSSIAVKVQRILCVVYDEVSLKILEITGTHNEASQKATELYGQKNIIAKQLIQKVSLFAGVAAILLISLMGFVSYRIEINNFSRQVDEIKESYAEVIRTALWIDDKDTIDLILVGICSLPGIQYAKIHSKAGVVCEAGKVRVSEKWHRIFPIRHVYKGEMLQLGELHVQGDVRYLHKKIVNMIFAIIFVQAVIIF